MSQNPYFQQEQQANPQKQGENPLVSQLLFYINFYKFCLRSILE
jgi:hypothetical protein